MWGLFLPSESRLICFFSEVSDYTWILGSLTLLSWMFPASVVTRFLFWLLSSKFMNLFLFYCDPSSQGSVCTGNKRRSRRSTVFQTVICAQFTFYSLSKQKSSASARSHSLYRRKPHIPEVVRGDCTDEYTPRRTNSRFSRCLGVSICRSFSPTVCLPAKSNQTKWVNSPQLELEKKKKKKPQTSGLLQKCL